MRVQERFFVCAVTALIACSKGPGSHARATAPPTSVAQPVTAPAVASAAEPIPEADPTLAAVCERFAATPIPAEDVASDSKQRTNHACDAEALYYGIGTPVDCAAARRCAYAAAEGEHGSAYGNPEILMMIYANGCGVPANFDLALRFACQVGGAPAELGGRVDRLLGARQSGKLDEKLDICDDATSGLMTGLCAAQQERLAAVGRDARKRAATAGMPARELKALESAAELYFQAHSSKEVDQSGSLSASFSLNEEAHLRDELANALERLRDPGFVPATPDAQHADQELAGYLASLWTCKELALHERTDGAISRVGIRETQGKWLAYRQAFIALALKVQPRRRPEAWRAWLNRERLEQLRAIGFDC